MRVRPRIAQGKNCVAANLKTSAFAENEFNARNRSAHAATERSGITRSIVADSTGFAGSVEVVNLSAKPVVEGLRNLDCERSARRNHGAKTVELLRWHGGFSQSAKQRR